MKSKQKSPRHAPRLHKPSGQAYARVRDLSGKRRMVYLGAYGTPESIRLFADLREAERDGTLDLFLAGIESARARPLAARAALMLDARMHDGPSLKELVARFLCWAERYYQRDGEPTSELTSLRGAMRPLVALFGEEPADAFDVLKLKRVRQAIVDAGNEKKVGSGFARTFVNAQVHRIRRAFRWAVEEKLVPASVLHELCAMRSLKRGRAEGVRESQPRAPVGEADFLAVLPRVLEPVRGILELMWHSGMRCCEATQLRTRDIDRSGDVWLFRPRRSKTEHHVDHLEHLDPIAIGPRAQAVVAPFVKLDPDAYWFRPCDAVAEHNRERSAARATKRWPSHVRRYERERLARQAWRADPAAIASYEQEEERRPPSAPAERYTTDVIDYALRRACEKAGIKRWSVHQLRHAALTRIRSEFGAEAAVAIARHSDANVTRIYTRDSKRKLAASIAQKIG